MTKTLTTAKGRRQALAAANRILRKAGFASHKRPIAAKPLPSMISVSGLRPAWHGKA